MCGDVHGPLVIQEVLSGGYAGLTVVALFVLGVPRGLSVGIVSLLLGIVLIYAGNGPSYWSCVPTQLAEPHYWGHFFAALGTTLLSRRWNKRSESTDYTAVPGGGMLF